MELFKDERGVNHRSELEQSLKRLVDIYKRNPKDLVGSISMDREHKPRHEKCSGVSGAGRVTEKRICRCMFYYGKSDVCGSCALQKKWRNAGSIKVADYEVPTTHVLLEVGGIDLILDDQYAVEVKPKNSRETIVRMMAEILTYVQDIEKEYKPAICFFEGSKQMDDYRKLMNDGNRDFLYLLNVVKIKVFYVHCVEHAKGIMDYKILPIEDYEWSAE